MRNYYENNSEVNRINNDKRNKPIKNMLKSFRFRKVTYSFYRRT